MRQQVEIDNYIGNLTRPQIKLLLKIIGTKNVIVDNEEPDSIHVFVEDMIITNEFVAYLRQRYADYDPTASELYEQFLAAYPNLESKVTMAKMLRLLRNAQVLSKSFSVRNGDKVSKRVKIL